MQEKWSEILQQKITIDRKAGTVKTEDGNIYTRQELELLQNCSDKLKLSLHKIKNIFNGDLVPGPIKFLNGTGENSYIKKFRR